MKRRPVAAVLAACACAVAAAAPAAADPAAWLYTPDHVTEIDLSIPEESRAALAAEPREYVRATFTLKRQDGRTYGPLVVGLKLKGTATFRTLDKKAPFKLKFNEYVKGQKFLGLKHLTLNNMLQDPTMVHEVLAYKAFRAARLPAPRAGYSYVRVDGEDFGVYLNLETLDDVSLPRWYRSTQHLYQGEWTVDLVPGRESAFEVDEGDKKDRDDLSALIAAVDTWKRIGAVADLRQITRFWAAEKYIGHVDGYSGDPVPNNYYLHSDDAGRFTMIPWGTDYTWDSRLAYADPGARMFERCLDHAACRRLYHGAVLEVRAAIGAQDLEGLASKTAAMLDPWQRMDPRRESTLETIQTRLRDLHAVLAVRPFDDAWKSAHPRRLAIGGVRVARGRLSTIAAIPKQGRVSTRVTARIAGRRRTVCRTRPRALAPGTRLVGCVLTRAARRGLRAGALRATVRVRLLPDDGPATARTRRVTLARR